MVDHGETGMGSLLAPFLGGVFLTVYLDNRDSLRSKYLGKRVVIVKDKILGVYDSDSETIRETTKTMEMGTFCIKHIPVDPADEYAILRSLNIIPEITKEYNLYYRFILQ